jgi:hypothetical protein
MVEGFHQTFVLVAFLEDVADGSLGEVSGGDEALTFSGDAEIGGNRHDVLLVLMLRVDVCACLGNIRATYVIVRYVRALLTFKYFLLAMFLATFCFI